MPSELRERSSRLASRWSFGPVPDGPRLFVTSATLLFVELLLIRWIPANVLYFGYFSNLILMASFLGMGVGILFGRRCGPSSAGLPFPPFAPILVVVLIGTVQVNLQLRSPTAWSAGLLTSTSPLSVGGSW